MSLDLDLNGWYILDGNREPVKSDARTVSKWQKENPPIVERTTIGRIEISTVFLYLDYRCSASEPPHINV